VVNKWQHKQHHSVVIVGGGPVAFGAWRFSISSKACPFKVLRSTVTRGAAYQDKRALVAPFLWRQK